MRLTFRATLLSILLTLLLGTVAALGYSSYRNARFTAEDLTTQILEQNSLRVDGQINGMLRAANAQGEWCRHLIESGLCPPGDLAHLGHFWLAAMQQNHAFTRLSLGAEATGEWFYARHHPGKPPVLGELRRDPVTGQLDLREYLPGDSLRKPFLTRAGLDADDPRPRPWYAAAKAAGRQIWSETYVLFGAGGEATSPGVTCATPVRRPDGSLLGVLDASFELATLCRFLNKLPVGRTGYAFVVEYRRDGSRRVIAHPRADCLLRTVSRKHGESVRELVSPEALTDGCVQAFLNALPPGTTPHGMEGTGRLRFTHDDATYLGSFNCLSTRETPDWLVCIVLPEAEVLERVEASNRTTAVVALLVLAIAIFLSLGVSRLVARPLELLAREAAAVGRLDVEARAPVRSPVLEVDRLARAAEEMKTSLRSFRKYVPADLVQALMASGTEAEPGGENKILTVFFCDVANFTTISEGMTPRALVAHLGEYLEALSAEIVAAGGTVDKYVGDGIMAFWGAPAENPRHATDACVAAVRCQQRLCKLRDRWTAEGKPPFHVRIGLNTGEVVVGNVGSSARLNYTVIGDPVNVASRLEGLNKEYGTRILLSESTYREASSAIVARPLDLVSVKGKTEPVLVYELLGLRGEVEVETEALAELFTAALACYGERAWADAIGLLEQTLPLRPRDEPALRLIERCRALREQPPCPEWDGVRRMERK
jgi:adenylate cyclase